MTVKIVLDPGHGGKDPGAVAHGMREADVNLDVARAAAAALRGKHGAEILLTREADEYVSLQARAERANAWGAELFLSIHTNAGGGQGFESYRHPAAAERTRDLHRAIHQELAEFFAGCDRQDRGMKEKNLHVLRETRMPAVLLECLFLDHPADAVLLACRDFRRDLGEAVAWAAATALGLGAGPAAGEASGRETAAPPAGPGGEKLYRVQVGAFASQQAAETLAEKLRRAGYDTTIIKR